MRLLFRVFLLGTVMVQLASCNLLDLMMGGAKHLNSNAKRERIRSSKERAKPRTKKKPVPPEVVEAQRRRANQELLQEIYHVVFLTRIDNRPLFLSWSEALHQGASLEGVYNGFIHSRAYRHFEGAGHTASAKALSTFGRELARLQSVLQFRTVFTRGSASPQAEIDPTQVRAERVEDEREEAKLRPFDEKQMAREYSRLFVGASIYTLKRVLGEVALQVVAERSEYHEKLARWYSTWAVEMNQYSGVSYGVKLRHHPGLDFHYEWAMKASQDRITWEVLNRIHRVLNSANQLQQGAG